MIALELSVTHHSGPKKAMRCVHCLSLLEKKTKDHVFPSSWYPATTPEKIQRWTVPSCGECNGKYGEMEKELFIRAAMCVGPLKAEAAGLSRKAVESLGVGVSGLSPEEKKHREALKKKIVGELEPYVAGTPTFPGLGLHKGFSPHQQYMVKIPEVLLKEVAGKIVRGCEYVLGNQRLTEDPAHLRIYFAEENSIQDVLRVFDKFGAATHLGPGFRVTRAVAHDDHRLVMYKIDIWGTWSIFAVIGPPDNERETHSS